MMLIAREWWGAASVRCARLCGFSPQVSLRGWLYWAVRRMSLVLGKPGVLAIGMLVVLPPFYFSAIVPAQERLDAARHGALTLSEQAGKPSGGIRRAPGAQLAEFYRHFPAERDAPQWLEKLEALAAKNGLNLNEGEYKATPDKVGRLVRLQIMLPVTGEYQQIRGFLIALPAEIPAIALENVSFVRQTIVEPTVAAQIRLVLYLERAS
ncbi:MAG TPA: type 4a pilus biogenesis protein PilO [Gallionella sp.]|nr:type 4a pilus biogenesis protein PilO [Gallionella sp.]